MTVGRRGLSVATWGKETTNGTAVATDTVWRGPASFIDDQRVLQYVAENIGYFGGADRTYIPKLFAMLELQQTEATFENLPPLLMMSGWGPVSGTADGSASSGYTYTGTVPANAAPALTAKACTWETGDDAETTEMEYTHLTQLTLSGRSGAPVMVSATLQGRQAQRVTATGGLSVADEDVILTGKGSLYLDAEGGTIGSTQISNQLLAFEINITLNWIPKFTLDGQLYFSYPQYTGHEITGSLTYEHDTADIAGSGNELQNWRDQVARLMRLDFTGEAYGTAGSGTTFSGVKGLRIDLPIKYTKFQPIDEQDGNSIVVAEFTSKYNATADTAGSILVANEDAAL